MSGPVTQFEASKQQQYFIDDNQDQIVDDLNMGMEMELDQKDIDNLYPSKNAKFQPGSNRFSQPNRVREEAQPLGAECAPTEKVDSPQKSYFFTGENVDFSNERIHMMAGKEDGGALRNPQQANYKQSGDGSMQGKGRHQHTTPDNPNYQYAAGQAWESQDVAHCDRGSNEGSQLETIQGDQEEEESCEGVLSDEEEYSIEE